MQIHDVPWSRLVHFYGRATEIPAAIERLATGDHRAAEEELARNLEHQDGVIQATPLAVHFIIDALRGDRVRDRAAVEGILRRVLVAARFQLTTIDGAVPSALEDVYAADKLWPEFESDEEDEVLWEEWSPSEEEYASWATLTEREIGKLG